MIYDKERIVGNVGITIIIIILIPILFQIIILSIKQNRRHKEIQEILKRIEEKLKK
jgi:preprotein translocase subunit YajC